MKSNRGFTLVELIVAIALIGIIAMGFITAMSTHYVLLTKTKAITVADYEAQRDIEEKIEAVKEQIENNEVIADGIDSYTLFSSYSVPRTVTTYNRSANISGSSSRQLFTSVADIRTPELPTASIAGNRAFFKLTPVEKITTYSTSPGVFIDSETTLNDPNSVHMLMIHRWWASRKGFNIPTITAPPEDQIGLVYPRFPEDYTIIAEATDSKILNTADYAKYANYAGRHIVHTATSASTFGKMSAAVPSMPIFMSGLPITNDLVVHLDASFITDADDAKIGQWNNLAYESGLVTQNNRAIQSDVAEQPTVKREKVGSVVGVDGRTYDSYAKYVQFDGNSIMNIPDHATLALDDMTVFVVARTAQGTSDRSIVSKIGDPTNYAKSWRIGWNDVDTLGMMVNDGTLEDRVNAGLTDGLDNDWHILVGAVDPTSVDFMMDDGSVTMSQPRTAVDPYNNNNSIEIGGDRKDGNSIVDIAEIIIYRTKLSEADRNKVRDYLNEKYMPIPPTVSLYMLNQNLTDVVLQNAPYTLPTQVPGVFTDSTHHDVNVQWFDVSGNPVSTVNTSSLGEHLLFTAKALSNPAKTTTLKLNVVNIVSWVQDPITATVDLNSTYAMPTHALANVENATVSTTKYVEVQWNNSISTASLGVKHATGYAKDKTSLTLGLDVTVVAQRPTSVVLNLDSHGMRSGETVDLNETVYPVDANDKTVSWSSSNEAVATVDGNGVVTAVAPGISVITVKTNTDGPSGPVTDTCQITVIKNVTGLMLDRTTVTLGIGNTQTIVATVSPSDATDKRVTWTSSDPNVATVNALGMVTGVREGTATIKAKTVDGGFEKTCAAVVGKAVTGVKLQLRWGSWYDAPESIDEKYDDYRSLRVIVSPSDALNRAFTVESDNPSVVRVAPYDSDYRMYFEGTGEANITVTTVDGGYTDTLKVNITYEYPVTDIELDKNDITLQVGETYRIYAEVSPWYATNDDVNWSVNNPSYITITSTGENSTGPYVNIRADSIGETYVIGTTVDGNFTDSCKVTVTMAGPVAQSVSGPKDKITIVFDKGISSASITENRSRTTISGNSVTFEKTSSWNYDNNETISVTGVDGSTSETSIRWETSGTDRWVIN
jgi:prepilin-type N-terminal cleavage/methylation domain-containing protein